jgi:hypothetical protein
MTIEEFRKNRKARRDASDAEEEVTEKHLELRAQSIAEYEFLVGCQLLYKANDGSAVSPCEEFLVRLLFHYIFAALKPADAAGYVKEFESNFETCMQAARKMLDDYPDELQDEARSALDQAQRSQVRRSY